MSYTFDPLLLSGLVPINPNTGGGVPTVPSASSLPTTSSNGALYVAQDTGNVYEYRTSIPGYVIVAGPGVIESIGTIDSQTPSSNGAVDANNSIVLQSASNTVPGLVNNTTQSFSGKKTFTTGISLSSNQINNVANGTATTDAVNLSQLQLYIPLIQEGVANGVATLDGTGKVPVTQLPNSVFEFQGSWNPNTNTPALSDGTGTAGYVYYVSAARSTPVTGLNNSSMTNFQIGDLVIYSGSLAQYELSSPAAGVQSVNGQQGVVTVNAINQLTGDVTTTAASGSQSKVASLVATTNSTLTTLSALSLPTSQLSGNINLTTQVSNTLPITNGGTGQTTANSAFNALSPMTTAGDIIYENSTPGATRLPIGTSNQVLTVSGGLPAWVTPTVGANQSLSNLTTTSINANLIPATNNSISLGTTSLTYSDLYTQAISVISGLTSIGNIQSATTPSGSASGFGVYSGNTNENLLFYTPYALGSTPSIYTETGYGSSSTNQSTGSVSTLTGAQQNSSSTGNTGSISQTTGNNSGSGNSGSISFQTGTTVSGTSGNISLTTGSGTGSRGNIQFKNGTEGTAGYVWTSTDSSGSGAWVAAGSTGDISQTSFVVANNNSTASNVTGLAFSTSTIESAQVQYSIVINATTSLYESGNIYLINRAGTWSLAQESNFDNTNVIFSVTSAGQVQYTSPNYSGYTSGKMKFRATVTGV